LDIFELTCANKWIPARFRSTSTKKATIDALTATKTVEAPVDTLVESLSFEVTRDSPGPIMEEDPTDFLLNKHAPTWMPAISFKVATSKKAYSTKLKPWHRVKHSELDPSALRQYLGWRPVEIIKATLKHTTQLAKTSITYPLQRHFKARNPFSNVHRLNEVVSTDPIFANCKSLDNKYTGAQVFYGLKLHCITVYGFQSKGEFPRNYQDFLREQGAPSFLRGDNAKEE